MNKEITFKEYSYLMNRIAYYLVKENKTFKTKAEYNTDNRKADYATIRKVLLDRGTNYQTDPMMNEFVESTIHENKNNLNFMPNYVTGSDGTKYYKNTYVAMAEWVGNYEVVNKKHPETVSTNITTTTTTSNSTTNCSNPYTQKPVLTNTGVTGMGQGTPYYCACNSVQQAIYKLTGKNISEYTLANVMGTTTSGTGHNGIETAIAWFNKNYGYNLKIEWKNFSSLGNSQSARFKALGELMCQSNKAIFCHLNYRNQWGHYEVPKTVNTATGQLVILNSLGNRCNSPAYCGYQENRSFNTQAQYIAGISQKGICIISK